MQVQTLKKTATPAQEVIIRAVVGLVDRRYTPNFLRASNELHSILDAPKDPYLHAIDNKLVEGKDYNIFTDGQYISTLNVNSADGGSQKHFAIVNYNYIVIQIIARDAKGYVVSMKQDITVKDPEIKIFCQHMLGLALG